MKFKSITTKITLFFGIIMVVICLGLGLSAFFSARNALQESIDENLLEIANTDAKIAAEKVKSQLNALEALANSWWLKSDELPIERKLDLLRDEVKRAGHQNIFIINTNGDSLDVSGISDNVADREYFKKALSGESNVSDPIISKADSNMMIMYAVPIKIDDEVVGVLAARRNGVALSNFTIEMQSGERQIYMINKEGTIVAHNDFNLILEMSNTIKDYEKNADPQLEQLYNLEKKMVAGETGVGEYTYNGVTKYMGYAPVEGTNWSLAVTAPKSVVMAKVNTLTTRMIIISILFFVIGLALTIVISRRIARPIKEATQHLNVIATGDFTGEIPRKLLNMQDETGILANALDKMQSSMRTMMQAVVNESSSVSQMLININQDVERLNQSIEQISATTEELSAGTEETAASAEEMNATSLEVERAIESVASRAQAGADTVNTLNKMSEDMKKNAISSKEEAMKIYSRAKADLQDAIEQSKAVNQINELSNAILEITSQTNLLALNAAIEAARAGEAGRGFVVVADEIRKLAEDSNESVARIQEVTQKIYAAVNTLSSNSMEIMEFIDKKVLSDYESLVRTSEQYSENSTVINDIVMEFSSTSEELLASMQNMVEAITQISTAANDQAGGATNIAQETTAVVQMANHVKQLAMDANEKSESLIKLVKQFQI
ncbi:MAG TPA: methyl-accepting chemotaxis protein [Peptococcaceae bacterium]|nr:methyl-accepting chemotaxis protein [Peptococcaceae bacterium]